MSIINTKSEGAQSVGQRVSKSIKEQNKYLFNYIHKLEFLISQTHKERANQALKFKKLVSHISHGSIHKNIMAKGLNRTLRRVVNMAPKDTKWRTQKDDRQDNAQEDDYLNFGYATNIKNKDLPSYGEDDNTEAATSAIDVLGDVKWLKNNLLTGFVDNLVPSKMNSINDGMKNLNMQTMKEAAEGKYAPSGRQSYNDIQDHKLDSYMKSEWSTHQALLLKHRSERTQSKKMSNIQPKHSKSESITNHYAYKNQEITNMEAQFDVLCRKSQTPMNLPSNGLKTNGKTGINNFENYGQTYPNNQVFAYEAHYPQSKYSNKQSNGF